MQYSQQGDAVRRQAMKSSEDTVIPPHKTVMVGTGLAMEIPEGYFGAIFARSGLIYFLIKS